MIHTPTAATQKMSIGKANAATAAPAVSRRSSASKNQRFHLFMPTSTSSLQTSPAASDAVSQKAMRAGAPRQKPPAKREKLVSR